MKNQIKPPNGFLYFVCYILIYPVLKIFFRLKVDRSGYCPPKGPFIVLSNHQSFMDFLLVMLAVYPRRLNAVAAQKFFYYRPLNTLMPVMGCIPKALFNPDARAIRWMMTVIQRGGRLLIFPEGRCGTDGVYAGIHTSTGKLIKKLNVPVIGCYIEGSYTCMPFWRKGIRLGRERVTLANLFTAEDTQELTIDEICGRVDRRLCGGDHKAPPKPFMLLRARRLAEGLQHILYYCPCCGREFTLETKGNIIRCASCGSAAVMNRGAKLTPLEGAPLPETIHAWFKQQVLYEAQFIQEDMEPVHINVRVRMPLYAGKGLTVCGQGALALDGKGWHYAGELSGENVRLFFPIETVPALPFDPNDNFQIYSEGKFYVFTPIENPSACSKYATLGECAYWRFSTARQMTRGYDSGYCDSAESAGSFIKP